jgi:hypothetical protein
MEGKWGCAEVLGESLTFCKYLVAKRGAGQYGRPFLRPANHCLPRRRAATMAVSTGGRIPPLFRPALGPDDKAALDLEPKQVRC